MTDRSPTAARARAARVRRGAALPAYALLLGLVAVGVAVAVETFGDGLENLFGGIAGQLNTAEGAGGALAGIGGTTAGQGGGGDSRNDGSIVVGSNNPDGTQLLAAADGSGAGQTFASTQSWVDSAVAGPEAVYVGDGSGNIYKLDKNGKVWRLDAHAHSSTVQALALDGGTLYSGSGDNTVKAWDVSGGKPDSNNPLWTFDDNGNLPNVFSLATDGGAVYAGDGDGDVHRIDAGNGKEAWEFHADSTKVLGLALDGGTLYTGGSNGGDVEAWNVSSGKPSGNLWRYTGPSSRVWSVVADGDAVYAGDASGVLHKIDAANGNADWTRTPSPGSDRIFGLALDAGGNVYAVGIDSNSDWLACRFAPDGGEDWCRNAFGNGSGADAVTVAPFQ